MIHSLGSAAQESGDTPLGKAEVVDGSPAIDTSELHRTLERVLRRPISGLTRNHLPYSSSFAIEQIELVFEGYDDIKLIFKNLSRDGLLDAALAIKPGLFYNPKREIQVYQTILSRLDIGAARCYGAVVDPETGRYWLFLEKSPGCELRQVGDFETWLEVARWLARFHASPVCEAAVAQSAASELLDYNADFSRTWFDRANGFTDGRFNSIIDRYERILEILLGLPRTLIHGEFYASNIIAQVQPGFRVCPVDWEMAGIGPGLLDLAALAAGAWDRQQRLRIAEAYCSCLPASLRPPNFVVAFDCCQLQIALQWLGWADQWTQSDAHAHDWLAEALGLIASDSLSAILR